MAIKIGDTVRFLSEVGGGRVSGFQGKDIVLVEDEDGFEIPTKISEVVKVDEDNAYETNRIQSHTSNPSKERHEAPQKEEPEPPVTFKPKPIERKGGDTLNVYLSFVPDDVKQPSTTRFEAYIVNDSNYWLNVQYLQASGNRWLICFRGEVEPNSKIFVEDFGHEDLQKMERICLQTIAWKDNKPFLLKPALSTEMRIDCTKFYKMHVFHPDEFFADPCWTIPVVKDDRSPHHTPVNAEQVMEQLLSPKSVTKEPVAEKKKPTPKPGGELVIDLHMEQVLDVTDALSSGDILMAQMNEFRRVMDKHLKHKGQKLIFIHGKGDGVLRKNILQELKYRYKTCTWQDASFREFGYGATLVQIG